MRVTSGVNVFGALGEKPLVFQVVFFLVIGVGIYVQNITRRLLEVIHARVRRS